MQTKRVVALISTAVLVVGCSQAGGSPVPGSATTAASATPAASTPTPSPTADPGQAVDIGGRSLFIECHGTGSPTVILEAGMTGDHRTWDQVVPEIEGSTRVCAYDRANIPPSDPAPTPRTAQDAVDDLAALLGTAGIEPPYVLVGFSMGGLIAQLYARTHADVVVGLVLVESVHPGETDDLEAHLTPAQIEENHAALLDNSEGFDPFASFPQVQAAGPMPQVPYVIITGAISEGWPSGWDASIFDRLRAEHQADLVTFIPGGRQVIAEESAHDVPGQQPELIVEAIQSVLADA